MSQLGFKTSEADPCLYLKSKDDKKIIVCLYVDDGLVAATDLEESENFIRELKSKFKITTQEAKYFLGFEIQRFTDGSLKINQQAYAKKVLQRFGMEHCTPVSTPMIKESSTEKTNDEHSNETFPYREAVGALMYLMLGTRPDLAYSVGVLSRRLENSSTEDWVKVKRVFRYIAGSLDKGITYKHKYKPEILECYSDADFGGCQTTGRSTSGVVVLYGGGTVSWFSQRQTIVATSTTEAEIIAASECSREVIWLKQLFRAIIKLDIPVVQVDNTAAIRLAQNPEFHRRTKHISIKHFFIREKVLEKELIVQQVQLQTTKLQM